MSCTQERIGKKEKFWQEVPGYHISIHTEQRKPLLIHLEKTLEFLNSHSVPNCLTQPNLEKTHVQKALKQLKLALANTENKELNLGEHFSFLELRGAEESLITGYYSPVFEASLSPSKAFPTPLYSAPSNLSLGSSNYNREQIDSKGALRGQGLEIAWLKSPLDAFILHVQGSGSLSLPDGTIKNVGVAATNNLPYTSIGKLLISDKKISAEDISLSSIRSYFADHPEELNTYLWQNERYVFFQFTKQVPLGSMGAPVGALMSLATEKFPEGHYRFPPHMPFYLNFSEGQNPGKHKHIVALNQDTGSAIKGDLRIDLYTGCGQKGENIAGDLKAVAKVTFLWPKGIPLPQSLGAYPVKDI
ncbi:MAG: MltA domain-containing protein [Planctomycetes bacterium]|nr:MltA domain-containing protein [Planctomycetota bacterium]